MKTVSEKSEAGIGWLEAQRLPVVFVSSSAEDARSLRHLLDAGRWLVVNVPDLTAALSVIEKLPPRLIVCDTEIDGKGSWRDLLVRHSSPVGAAFFVSSPEADDVLRREVWDLGGGGVLKRPFAAKELEQVIALVHQGIRDRRDPHCV